MFGKEIIGFDPCSGSLMNQKSQNYYPLTWKMKLIFLQTSWLHFSIVVSNEAFLVDQVFSTWGGFFLWKLQKVSCISFEILTGFHGGRNWRCYAIRWLIGGKILISLPRLDSWSVEEVQLLWLFFRYSNSCFRKASAEICRRSLHLRMSKMGFYVKAIESMFEQTIVPFCTSFMEKIAVRLPLLFCSLSFQLSKWFLQKLDDFLSGVIDYKNWKALLSLSSVTV